MIEVLGFAGSLRSGSLNRNLLGSAQEYAPEGLRIERFPIDDIPLYDADRDTEDRRPRPVQEFKRAIDEADALLVATPEYNQGLPGVTKNAIDWASRPGRDSVLRGKPAGIMGATMGPWGTARSQEQLKLALSAPLARVMPHPGLYVRRAHEKFDEDGRLVDDETRRRLTVYLAELEEWVREVGDVKAGTRG